MIEGTIHYITITRVNITTSNYVQTPCGIPAQQLGFIAITVGALTHYNRKSGIARCAIKADLRKAYYSLDWNFILMCLLSAGFPAKFVHWIMVCITYPRFSISLNGSLVVYFQGGKAETGRSLVCCCDHKEMQ